MSSVIRRASVVHPSCIRRAVRVLSGAHSIANNEHEGTPRVHVMRRRVTPRAPPPTAVSMVANIAVSVYALGHAKLFDTNLIYAFMAADGGFHRARGGGEVELGLGLEAELELELELGLEAEVELELELELEGRVHLRITLPTTIPTTISPPSSTSQAWSLSSVSWGWTTNSRHRSTGSSAKCRKTTSPRALLKSRS